MRTNKYLMLIAMCISSLLLDMNLAVARSVTFTGSLQSYDATPSANNIYIFQSGLPYFDNANNTNWQLLGETRSNSDGSFSTSIDIGENIEVVLVVPYDYPRYSLIKKVNVGPLVNITNINLILPSIQSQKLSYQVRIFENNAEIQYTERVYKIVAIPMNLADQGVWVELTDATYVLTKLSTYDMPDGAYKVMCLLASSDLYGGEKILEKEIVLPLTNTQVDFYFTK